MQNENYRELDMISRFTGLHGKVIKNKLEGEICRQIGEEKVRFTTGRSRIDHTYTN